MSKKIISQQEYDYRCMTFGETRTSEEYQPDTPSLVGDIVGLINAGTENLKGEMERQKADDMKGGNIQKHEDLHKFRN
ncbi:hypothetical protein CLV62_12226 [Dysgonomonas alginatilytica]|uniref:Uncharacterized protein n=1 Tax=Dysgonomonas alginatilytica TaxID=1605892 RepID=A0A2V3PKG1_9BACT|nr:hypothetical protein [Dysgonomonas alginatilytica]PXV62073.1 hypothetical protein CLV62_12226 [Dysgonomonas alginatilytica]